MAFLRRMKPVLETCATVLMMVAATLLLWTQIENRWFPPQPPGLEEDVKGLTIEASKIRHVKGEGTVALVEFTDYQCPFCGRFARDTAPEIDKKFVETGRIRYIVFNYPLEGIHPRARKAGVAAECAARQGRYWEMHQLLFNNPEAFGDDQALMRSGDVLGLNRDAFNQCLQGEANAQVTADMEEARRLGIRSTPTFFVGTVQPNGSIQLTKRVNGAAPFEIFQKAVDAVSPMKRAEH
jgi:protein-disulfide isomerase